MIALTAFTARSITAILHSQSGEPWCRVGIPREREDAAMINLDRPLGELSDDALAAHHDAVVLRLEELESMARASMVGLPPAQYHERLGLMARNAEIENEQRRREDQRPLDVASEYHRQSPELLEVLASGSTIALAKYLHDRTPQELHLLADRGPTVAMLAGRILRHRREQERESA